MENHRQSCSQTANDYLNPEFSSLPLDLKVNWQRAILELQLISLYKYFDMHKYMRN